MDFDPDDSRDFRDYDAAGDGTPDEEEAGDSDGDVTPDALDVDADGDGFVHTLGATGGACSSTGRGLLPVAPLLLARRCRVTHRAPRVAT